MTNNNVPWTNRSRNYVPANSPVNSQVNPAQDVTRYLSKNHFNICFPHLCLKLSKRYSVWHFEPTYERSTNFALLRLSSSCNCPKRRKLQTRKETWCLFEWLDPIRSAEPWCVHFERQGAQSLRQVQRYRPMDTVSHPRRPDFYETPLLEHQIPHTSYERPWCNLSIALLFFRQCYTTQKRIIIRQLPVPEPRHMNFRDNRNKRHKHQKDVIKKQKKSAATRGGGKKSIISLRFLPPTPSAYPAINYD